MKRRLALALIFLVLAGCSTVEDRIKEKPYAYAQLSATDQALVRSRQVRNGFTQDQVYLAWSKPDHVISGFRQGHPYEAWVYTTYRTVYTGYYYPFYARFGFYNYYNYWPGFPDLTLSLLSKSPLCQTRSGERKRPSTCLPFANLLSHGLPVA